MFRLQIGNKQDIEFETYDELYSYFDNEVELKDIDDCKVYVGSRCLGTPTEAYKSARRYERQYVYENQRMV